MSETTRIDEPSRRPDPSFVTPVGGPAVPTDPFPGEFLLRKRLGGGGFGEVWLADDLSPLRRQVALKFLALKRGYDKELAALRNEAAALASVRHPNVVQVFQWKQTAAGLPCLVLQFVPGGALTDRVLRAGPFTWQVAGRYIADVAAGLQAVHARGLVHRDIKPDNILHDPEADEALLTDFGIAARLVEARGAAGTLPFMAPEAIEGRSGPPMDVYSLAASLYWLLTGEAPYPGRDELQTLAAIRAGLPSPDPRLAGVPAAMEDLMRRGLAPAPERRPPLAEFHAGLRGALNALLADALKMPAGAAVGVRIVVSRRVTDAFVPVAASSARASAVLRDLKRVPPPPDRVRVRTGDRVRIQVEADQPGYAVVFNVGPTGNLNLLSPLAPTPVGPDRPLHLIDVEMTPPAGNERIFALWTRRPLPLRLEELRSLVEHGGTSTAGAYRATRDMARVKESLDEVPADDRRAAVLELEHAA